MNSPSDPQTYQQVMDAFLHARSLPAPERSAYLDSLRASSQHIASTVEGMLHHDEHPAPILEFSAPAGDREHSFSLDDRGAAWLPYAIGGYRILRLVGRGGMGSVFEAVQGSPPRRVALKAINPASAIHLDPSRFEQEARVLARLEHPGIARVYEAGRAQEGGIRFPFFAMELIEGSTITDHAADRGLDIRARIRLLILVCQAVQYAHDKGVLHRDLKPDNILVDAFGQPKLLDFGLARSIAAGGPFATFHTVHAQPAGTPAYMSPEQAAGLPIDARSDQYSLGIILHELLSGQRPAPRPSAPTILLSGRIAPPPVHAPLGRLDRTLRGDIETIVSKAIDPDPDRRYATVQALADDLQRYLDGLPIDARPRSLAYSTLTRIRRVRRAGGWVTAATAFAAGVILAIVLSYAYFSHQNVLNEAAAFRDIGDRLQALRDNDAQLAVPFDPATLRERIAGLSRQDPNLERRLLIFAGSNLTRFAPSTAHLELGESLLRWARMPARADQPRRSWDVDAVLVENLLRQDRPENACDLLGRVITDATADRVDVPAWVAKSLDQAAEVFARQGQTVAAAAALNSALVLQPRRRSGGPGDADTRVRILARLARVELAGNDLDSAIIYARWAREARNILTSGRDVSTAAELDALDRDLTGFWLQKHSGLPVMQEGRQKQGN